MNNFNLFIQAGEIQDPLIHADSYQMMSISSIPLDTESEIL